MRSICFILSAAICLFCISTARADWPARIFAPYQYVGSGDNFKLTDCDDACGLKFYTLAFIIADKQNNPAWDGRIPMEQNFYADQITAIRQRGGDVIVSFGGEAGIELAIAEQDPAALLAKYQAIVDRYKLTWLDFDIEGDALSNSNANHRRNDALVKLQSTHPDLIITYTLPVDPNGISRESQSVLADAKSKGLKVRAANIMVMDFGSHFSAGKKMADVSIASANKAHEQIEAIDPNIQISLCPDIGQNDEKGEIFHLEDAKSLLDFAQHQPWVDGITYWSINRDAGKTGRRHGNTSSGIPQKPLDFANIFKLFTNSSVLPSTQP